MVSTSKAITHNGKVVSVTGKQVQVSITRSSACSACHAKGFCSSSDSKDQLLTMPNHDSSIKVNDEVVVSIKRSMGFQAVALAFIIPLMVFIAVIVAMRQLTGVSEELAGIIGLLSLLPYFGILYLLNRKLANRFVFHIEKLQ